MLVRVKAGAVPVYREGYTRDEEDGVFRLYRTPEQVGAVDADGAVDMEKYLGSSLELVTGRDAEDFEHAHQSDEFADTVSGENATELMGRAGAITMAVMKLDPGNDAHWQADGRPNPKAVGDLGNLYNVQASEVEAVQPGFSRPKHAAPRKRVSDRG